MCFEVKDLDGHIALMKAQKSILVRRPQPGVAFGGRRVAWMQTCDRMLIEFVERA